MPLSLASSPFEASLTEVGSGGFVGLPVAEGFFEKCADKSARSLDVKHRTDERGDYGLPNESSRSGVNIRKYVHNLIFEAAKLHHPFLQ